MLTNEIPVQHHFVLFLHEFDHRLTASAVNGTRSRATSMTALQHALNDGWKPWPLADERRADAEEPHAGGSRGSQRTDEERFTPAVRDRLFATTRSVTEQVRHWQRHQAQEDDRDPGTLDEDALLRRALCRLSADDVLYRGRRRSRLELNALRLRLTRSPQATAARTHLLAGSSSNPARIVLNARRPEPGSDALPYGEGSEVEADLLWTDVWLFPAGKAWLMMKLAVASPEQSAVNAERVVQLGGAAAITPQTTARAQWPLVRLTGRPADARGLTTTLPLVDVVRDLTAPFAPLRRNWLASDEPDPWNGHEDPGGADQTAHDDEAARPLDVTQPPSYEQPRGATSASERARPRLEPGLRFQTVTWVQVPPFTDPQLLPEGEREHHTGDDAHGTRGVADQLLHELVLGAREARPEWQPGPDVLDPSQAAVGMTVHYWRLWKGMFHWGNAAFVGQPPPATGPHLGYDEEAQDSSSFLRRVTARQIETVFLPIFTLVEYQRRQSEALATAAANPVRHALPRRRPFLGRAACQTGVAPFGLRSGSALRTLWERLRVEPADQGYRRRFRALQEDVLELRNLWVFRDVTSNPLYEHLYQSLRRHHRLPELNGFLDRELELLNAKEERREGAQRERWQRRLQWLVVLLTVAGTVVSGAIQAAAADTTLGALAGDVAPWVVGVAGASVVVYVLGLVLVSAARRLRGREAGYDSSTVRDPMQPRSS